MRLGRESFPFGTNSGSTRTIKSVTNRLLRDEHGPVRVSHAPLLPEQFMRGLVANRTHLPDGRTVTVPLGTTPSRGDPAARGPGQGRTHHRCSPGKGRTRRDCVTSDATPDRRGRARRMPPSPTTEAVENDWPECPATLLEAQEPPKESKDSGTALADHLEDDRVHQSQYRQPRLAGQSTLLSRQSPTLQSK